MAPAAGVSAKLDGPTDIDGWLAFQQLRGLAPLIF